MNKKVLSAILFGALMAGTGTFTSCIDNDEPAGIEELRGAKAELLRAKATVEAAKVALVQAEAAAKQAEAELLKIQAAAEQAKNAAELKVLQAEAEEAIAKAEKARHDAEYAYQESIIKLKELQAGLVGKQATAIASYVTAYETALEKYYTAVDIQTSAQRKVSAQLAVVEENEAQKEYYTRGLSRDVYYAEVALEGQKEALAVAQEEYAAAQELEPHALADKLTALEARQKEIKLAIADLSVEAAETMQKFYDEGRVKEVNDLWDAYVELGETEQVIPAVEFDFADGTGYPLYAQRGVLSFEELTYTDYDRWNFNARQADLEQLVAEFKAWTRDENDNAWTAEAIVLMEGDLAKLEKDVEAVKKAWAEAVAAFNTGKYNESDPSKISGYAELVAALDAYNTAATDWNTAEAAVAPLNTEAADKKAMNDAIAANQKAFDAAKKAADDAKATAEKAENLAATVKAKQAVLDKAAADAEAATLAAKKAYDDYVASANPDAATIGGYKTLWDLAVKAQGDAEKAASDYKTGGEAIELKAISDAHTKAIADATKAQADADAAAKKAYDDKWADAEKGTGWVAIKAAQKAADEKLKVAKTAHDALVDAAQAYVNNIPEIGLDVIKADIFAAYVGVYDDAKGFRVKSTIKIEDLLVLDKNALVNVVKSRSNALFGTAYSRNAYGDFEARLKEMTTEEIEALIAEEEIYSFNDYVYECGKFGLVGDVMALTERIRIAKSWLENGELIEAKIKQAEEALAALIAADEAYVLSLEEKYAEYDAAWIKLDEDRQATLEPIFAKREELEPLNALYEAYIHAINDYREAGELVYTEEQIERYVAYCKLMVASAEDAVYEAETELMTKEILLSKWNSGAISLLEAYQIELEDATAKVERAHEKLVIAQTRLQQAMEALKWTAAE